MRGGVGTVRRSGLRLALFAMLVQFVATYGHLHPEDFYRFFPGDNAAVVVTLPSSQHAPIGLDDDGDCPLCLSLQMVGSSALPDAVALPLPGLARTAARITRAPWRFSPAPQLPFQTRAPPFA